MATKEKPKAKSKLKTKARATKKTTKAAKKKTPGRRGARSASSASGPVTLEEARTLAQARQPQRAARRAPVSPATPGTVGAEREELDRQRRAERARRKREYRDMMNIMKRRGARAPRTKESPAAGRRAVELPTRSFDPLQIFAEGDSWFDYPVPFFGGGIVPRLESRLGVPILNMAEAGDEVRFMLGVEQRKRLIELLHEGCPAGGPWDVMLFSGGGNDIVDNPMALWIRDWDAQADPAALINQSRFDAALALVRAGYEDLIGLRDKLSPSTHLILHGYDFAIPDGRGICHLGPWLKPTFDLRGFPTQAAAFAVVQAMLRQFAAMLTSLASAHDRVTFINTQGTLEPQAKLWHNELHPNKSGFRKFSEIFQQRIKELFPDRVA